MRPAPSPRANRAAVLGNDDTVTGKKNRKTGRAKLRSNASLFLSRVHDIGNGDDGISPPQSAAIEPPVTAQAKPPITPTQVAPVSKNASTQVELEHLSRVFENSHVPHHLIPNSHIMHAKGTQVEIVHPAEKSASTQTNYEAKVATQDVSTQASVSRVNISTASHVDGNALRLLGKIITLDCSTRIKRARDRMLAQGSGNYTNADSEDIPPILRSPTHTIFTDTMSLLIDAALALVQVSIDVGQTTKQFLASLDAVWMSRTPFSLARDVPYFTTQIMTLENVTNFCCAASQIYFQLLLRESFDTCGMVKLGNGLYLKLHPDTSPASLFPVDFEDRVFCTLLRRKTPLNYCMSTAAILTVRNFKTLYQSLADYRRLFNIPSAHKVQPLCMMQDGSFVPTPTAGCDVYTGADMYGFC